MVGHMSTRGLYGFRKNEQDKTTYNHSDSYPDWLGRKFEALPESEEECRPYYDKLPWIKAIIVYIDLPE